LSGDRVSRHRTVRHGGDRRVRRGLHGHGRVQAVQLLRILGHVAQTIYCEITLASTIHFKKASTWFALSVNSNWLDNFPWMAWRTSFSDHVEWRNSGEDSRLHESNCSAPIAGTKKNLHTPLDMDVLQP
jgi:hypothetical protein